MLTLVPGAGGAWSNQPVRHARGARGHAVTETEIDAFIADANHAFLR